MRIIDSHTEGEPTRVVVDGWGEVQGATMAERREEMRRHHEARRRAVVCEPRGHNAVVGALLTPPVEPGSLAGVVFFDNAGYLGMCGHGTIGVIRTLDFLGRLPPADAQGICTVRLDTPVGTVSAEVHRGSGGAGAGAPGAPGAPRWSATITNVPARCHARDITVRVPELGEVIGDVAYGGNWFFLLAVEQLRGLTLARGELTALTAATLRIRAALGAAGITGDGGADIDHVEVFGPPSGAWADSRNFVLCPGGAYDRSPCGTGTSAKLAALHARGRLALGQRWRQEGFVGGLFTSWLTAGEGGTLLPHINGRAFVNSEATLHFDPADPFREGIPEP